MKAKLISYNLSNLSNYKKVLVSRILHGYTDNSNNGAYRYERKGILNEIPHHKLNRGVIIIKKEDEKRFISVLNKYNVECQTFEIVINQKILK